MREGATRQETGDRRLNSLFSAWSCSLMALSSRLSAHFKQCVKLVHKQLGGLVQLRRLIHNRVSRSRTCGESTTFLLSKSAVYPPSCAQLFFSLVSVTRCLYPFYTGPIITTTKYMYKIITSIAPTYTQPLVYLKPVHKLSLTPPEGSQI